MTVSNRELITELRGQLLALVKLIKAPLHEGGHGWGSDNPNDPLNQLQREIEAAAQQR